MTVDIYIRPRILAEKKKNVLMKEWKNGRMKEGREERKWAERKEGEKKGGRKEEGQEKRKSNQILI